MRAELGPITRPEISTLVAIAVGFALWTTEPWHHTSTGMVAVIMVVVLFLPWTGITMADHGRHNLLYDSGAVTWLAGFLVEPIKASGLHSPVLLLVLAFALHVARAGVLSGGAVAAAFVPLTIALATSLHLNVLPFALILTDALKFTVFVPISSVAVLIAFEASGLRWGEMLRLGALISVIANVYLVITHSAWMSLLGHPP
jgi:sodium-dependent dicarboxylate transporter 2/3/5